MLAGDLSLNNLIDKNSDAYWDALNTYDFLDEKDFKDVKYIDEQWKAQMDGTEAVGVQGQTTSRSYFTQKQRYQKFYDAKWYDTKLQENDPIGWSAAYYKDWEEMHKPSIMWFDTAGCFDPNAFASTQ